MVIYHTKEWKPETYVSQFGALMKKGLYTMAKELLQYPPPSMAPEHLQQLQEAALQQKTSIAEVEACINGLLDE